MNATIRAAMRSKSKVNSTGTKVRVRRTQKTNNTKRDLQSTNKVILKRGVCGGCDGEAAKRRGGELARPRRAHNSPATRALECDVDGDGEGVGDRDGDNQRGNTKLN